MGEILSIDIINFKVVGSYFVDKMCLFFSDIRYFFEKAIENFLDLSYNIAS